VVLIRGLLLKKNRWLMKQLRYFKLCSNGLMKYYKDFSEYKVRPLVSMGNRE